MHSPVELVQLSDVDAAVKLVGAAALSMNSDTSLVR
jgi:putative aminopeptidase FrvX